MRKKIKRILLVFTGLIVLFLVYFACVVIQFPPKVKDRSAENLQRKEVSKDFYTIGNNWLKKNAAGNWEVYVEGDDFERGVIYGKLTKELAEKQEIAFINQLQQLVPSRSYLNFLKYFVAYFNRNLDQYVTDEYKREIYGVSLSASDLFDDIGPKYQRMLNYHAAHDIGHALQDKNMTVGCTAFSAWNNKSADSKLIVGRNFDFFAGDDFAANKLICFFNPSKGYKFAFVSWAGFVGCVSGLNDQGISVTLNAAKSDIPSGAATPISLVGREILQYAGNIEEAYAIAKKRKTFVSESIFIGSGKENCAVIIEKTPTRTNLYRVSGDEIICPNHYQSDSFSTDYDNEKNQVESSSLYRKLRTKQLMNEYPRISYLDVARILRDQKGINGKDIGLGNEKGLNQLLAHHAVIFKPQDELMWVSSNPYQLGAFNCYDLNKVFREAPGLKEKKEICESSLTIPADPFLKTKTWQDFNNFKMIKHYIQACTKARVNLKAGLEEQFIASNPQSYFTYWILADYYRKMDDKTKAIALYKQALTKEVATGKEAEKIRGDLLALEKKN
ncbi:MAG TPA: C45 family peptidase [Bacteroidia bacterium]|nr:C45 family peptidase [Bacteroidia bacterium]